MSILRGLELQVKSVKSSLVYLGNQSGNELYVPQNGISRSVTKTNRQSFEAMGGNVPASPG
jgi:hypothetical protein